MGPRTVPAGVSRTITCIGHQRHSQRVSYTAPQPLSVRAAERFVGAVSRSGMSFTRDSYEALRYVRPDLPSWDVLSCALRRSSLYGRLVEDSLDIELTSGAARFQVTPSTSSQLISASRAAHLA